jgi:hypothetical protein
MSKENEKKSQSRMVIAATLFFASIATSFLIAYLSSQGSAFWVLREPLPAGAHIRGENVALVKIKLSRATDGYLPSSVSPVGSITRRAFAAGEILHRSALTDSADRNGSESVSLSIRSSDIPTTIEPGNLVSIYQLHDIRNGENAIAPRLVISPVFIKTIVGKEGNFSGEISVTVSLNREEVPTLLAATTSGRLVIVAISG